MTERSIETAFPLTPLQEGMLYHTLRFPDSAVYRGQCTATYVGTMNDEAFRGAWSAAARRHQAFRTFFAWEGRDRPLQVVWSDVVLPWHVVDWSALPAEEQVARWERMLADDAATPFNLVAAPLMRFTLVHLGAERHRLLWSLHHALADGWSGLLVFKEVIAEYELLLGGGALDVAAPPSYATFVTWLGSRDHDAAREYWSEQLAGLEEATPPPGARRSAEGRTRATRQIALPEELMVSLERRSARMRVTPNTVAVGAWSIVLSRYHPEATEVTFGVTLSERPPEIANVERSVGLYLNTVPVRARVEPGALVADWLRSLQDTLSDGREHSAGGLADIARWAPAADGGPLVRSLVVYESFPPEVTRPRDDGELRIESTDISAPSDLPLAFLFYPDVHPILQVVYDPALYREDDAQALLELAARVLSELAEGEGTIGSIGRLGVQDERRLSEWGTATQPLPEAIDVLELFHRQVALTPDAPAVRDADGECTYRELAASAAAVTQTVRNAGLGSGSLVGIPAVRSTRTVTAVIGVLGSGAAYTLFDADQPPARLERLLGSVDRVVAWNDDTRWQDRSLLISGGEAERAQRNAGLGTEEASRTANPDDLAYVVWTSGSTGEPKGVAVEHRQLASSTAARLAYYEDRPEQFLMLSSLAVDSAVAGLYWTLCTGGCLVLPPERAEQDPSTLLELTNEGSVTTLLVPSLYRVLLDELDVASLSRLRRVVVAGETCPPSLVEEHRTRLPHAELHNEYGPSEATVWATVADLLAEPRGEVSIGRPVPGVRAYVLDSEGGRVPIGAPGEICLGGDAVARGYLDDAVMTAKNFVDDPFEPGARMYRTGDRGRFLWDGRLEFLGRVDEQIKIRGYRVEVGDIEATLESHPAIGRAAVTFAPAPPPADRDTLVALLLGRDEDEADALLAQVERLGHEEA